MKTNCGNSVNKGQFAALLVPASATTEAASTLYKGLAASVCDMLIYICNPVVFIYHNDDSRIKSCTKILMRNIL